MTNSMDEKLLRLHYIHPLPWQKIQHLLTLISDLDELRNLSPTILAMHLNIKQSTAASMIELYDKMQATLLQQYYEKHQIYAIPYTSKFYPLRLKEVFDPPAVIYAKGNISLLQEPRMMAVIGSRIATNYSENALKLLIPPLIQQKFVVVSGLAKGADRLAHEAAIRYGGNTIGVLGHGLFHSYPKENDELHRYMTEHQLVITEYPPYVGVQKWHFPARNRIISGLSEALLVTEAKLKSGTLITTELALEQGKDVFVVPGNIFSELSKGTNKLIKEGAIPVWDGHQMLAELQMFSNFR
ncbi:DNA-processing protein DprA [Solibacillus sp. MA9]|uniref:DNA-processing protein DprA n=1 Tax=Solibacillus palustris TaxID=2908203 RepID=A0ABS9U9C3_9BACL|nr:DNA-processing protein DprA [Solibacillus sp. MA9]MCH7320921.1 DNA-processing protein DprA [Solibacillus sp. MA9]